MRNFFVLTVSFFIITGCSMFGHSGVEIAPYEVLKQDNKIELRHYDRMVLVSTPMSGGMEEDNASFYRLFNYISGKNEGTTEIPMTAPVFMDQAADQSETMSFVLPVDTKIEDAPKPKDPMVKLEEITDYTVAVITFSGFLNQSSINKHKAILEQWIADNGYEVTGGIKAAGYNPPFTIPVLRRNEVLIPVKKP